MPCLQCWSHWCSSTSRTLGLGKIWVEVSCWKAQGGKEGLQKSRSILLVPFPFYQQLIASRQETFFHSQFCQKLPVRLWANLCDPAMPGPLGVYWAGHGAGCCMNDLVLLGRVCKYFLFQCGSYFAKRFGTSSPQDGFTTLCRFLKTQRGLTGFSKVSRLWLNRLKHSLGALENPSSITLYL